MSIDLSGKGDAELEQLIANHERAGAWHAPLFLAAVAERSRRRSGGLDPDRTLDLIYNAVRADRFVTYKDVAAQSDRPWDKVRWKVFDHLGDLCIREHARRRTLPTVFVVPELHRTSGKLEGDSYAGFERICLLLNPQESLRDDALVEQERDRIRAIVREIAP